MPDLPENPLAVLEKPLAIDFVDTPGDADDPNQSTLDEFLQQLRADVQGDQHDSTTVRRKWVNNYNWRRGLVGKKDKNNPFPNSSDLRYPISDMKIREKKAGLVSVVWDAPKIIRLTPVQGATDDSKERLEHFYNWLFRSKIPRFYFQVAQCADKMLEQGTSFNKTTWSHRTEWKTKAIRKSDMDALKAYLQQQKLMQQQSQQQAMQQPGQPPVPPQPTPKVTVSKDELVQAFAVFRDLDLDDKAVKKKVANTVQQYLDGKDPITYVENHVTYNGPVVAAVAENQSIIVPTNTTWIGDAERVCQESFYTKRELISESEENGGRFRGVDELLEYFPNGAAELSESRLDMEAARASAEGIKQVTEFENCYRVWEVCCWIPRKHISRFTGVGGDDDTPVRAIVAFVPQTIGRCEPLLMMEFPYDHCEWPENQFNYDYSIDRFYAHRGIPEKINAFEDEYNRSSNAALDRNTITLSPPTLINEAAGITPQQFRQVGQALEVECDPTIAVYMPQYPNLSQGLEFDAEKCMNWVDRVVGTTPPLPARATSPTKAEVLQNAAPSNSVDHYEQTTWLMSWSRTFNQVHALCKQYWFDTENKDEMSFSRTDKPDETVKITRKDFEGEYIVSAGGDPSKADAQFEFQKWFTLLQATFQYPQMAPVVKPYDVVIGTFSRLIGYAETAQIFESRDKAEEFKKMLMQMAAQQMANTAQGKRTRSPRIKEVPGSGQGLIPK